MTRRPLPAADRFYENVKIGPSTRACWLWKGTVDKDGYGKAGSGVGGRWEGAHRVAYRLMYGEIPPGKVVLHSCDEPLCCNPYHLSIGNQIENVRDMDAKGRRGRR